MKKSFFNSLLQLKPRQQTNQTEENLLANQKVRTKRHLKYSACGAYLRQRNTDSA